MILRSLVSWDNLIQVISAKLPIFIYKHEFFNKKNFYQGAIKNLGERGLPNLWIPKGEDFHKVDRLPVLGTGKLDLKGLKELALRLSQ